MAYYLGIDLGGTNIAVGVVDEHYQIIGRGKNKTRVPCSSEEMCEQLAVTAFAALEDAGVTIDDIPWVGIGTPVRSTAIWVWWNFPITCTLITLSCAGCCRSA